MQSVEFLLHFKVVFTCKVVSCTNSEQQVLWLDCWRISFSCVLLREFPFLTDGHGSAYLCDACRTRFFFGERTLCCPTLIFIPSAVDLTIGKTEIVKKTLYLKHTVINGPEWALHSLRSWLISLKRFWNVHVLLHQILLSFVLANQQDYCMHCWLCSFTLNDYLKIVRLFSIFSLEIFTSWVLAMQKNIVHALEHSLFIGTLRNSIRDIIG